MGAIVLTLAGPLQSWGAESRFVERKTRHEPTKSGVVGLLAAALGRSREDDLCDLACLPMAVRVDQPGYYERDFQTAHTRVYDRKEKRWVTGGKSLPLSRRYYIADAVFVVAIEMPDDKLDEMSYALQHPAFPLYLGRRSCAPSRKILQGSFEGMTAIEVLSVVSWQATDRKLIASERTRSHVTCEVYRDASSDDSPDLQVEHVHDLPESFSVEHRTYGWRKVVHTSVAAPNEHFDQALVDVEHDPMALFSEEG